MHGAVDQRAAVGAEHRPRHHRLRRGDRRIAVAHHRARDEAAFDDQLGLDAEERRLPEHEVRHLADRDRANVRGDAVRDRRIDRVLRDVAAHAQVVMARLVARQRTTLTLHLVRGLPRAADHFADAAHRLRVGRHHAERAEVVQHVLGGNRLRPDARVGERDVFRHPR